MDSLAKQQRFEEVIEPRYRDYMAQLGRAGHIERIQRMGHRLTGVTFQRHARQFADFPSVSLPSNPLTTT